MGKLIQSKQSRRFAFSRPLSAANTAEDGWSLIEVLVSLGVLLAGIVGIALYFPSTMETRAEAGYIAEAIMLANRKAQEARRDNDSAGRLINAIKAQGSPTVPIRFPEQPNLTYQFQNFSAVDTIDDPGDPRDDIGVARVVIRYATEFRPTADFLYELRFDQ